MSIKRTVGGAQVISAEKLVLGRDVFVRSDNGSEAMNIDGRAAGSDDILWNGTGVEDTGGDWTASGTGSETTESKKSGTNGWDTGVAALDDSTIFDNGSMTDIDGTYSVLEFWMQPKAYPPGSKLKIRWLDSSNDPVGSAVKVSDYTSNMDLDVWQQVSIPIVDFGLTGNVQKLRFSYRSAAGQRYWFDDIVLINISGGGPYLFQVEAPDSDTVYHLSMAVLVIAAPFSGWNVDAFANIANGLTLGLICRHRKKSENEVLWKFVTKTNLQLFGQYHPQYDVTFADDNLMIGFMIKPDKADVLITDDEVLEFVVRDDLSSISDMRAYCHYGIEDVSS